MRCVNLLVWKVVAVLEAEAANCAANHSGPFRALRAEQRGAFPRKLMFRHP